MNSSSQDSAPTHVSRVEITAYLGGQSGWDQGGQVTYIAKRDFALVSNVAYDRFQLLIVSDTAYPTTSYLLRGIESLDADDMVSKEART